VAGSGQSYILPQPRAWYRPLLSLVAANDHGQVSDILVADRLAALNYEVYEALKKARGAARDTVGPRSIVVWRRRPDVGSKRGGGGHQFYTGTDRDPDSPAIPSIMNGMDGQALVTILTEQLRQQVGQNGIDSTVPPPDLDTNEMNRRLAALPPGPDEKLR
jgi:hypothetical protein